jgi:hypothetical protein
MSAPDLLSECATLLSASTGAEGDIAIVYVAGARSRLERAREMLRSLELQVCARERELARTGAPKTQLEIGGADAKR